MRRNCPFQTNLLMQKLCPEDSFSSEDIIRGHHKIPVEKLEIKFGDCPGDLYKVSEKFNAKKIDYGDASVSLFVLPRIPLTIIIWGKCTEFEARASILFDQTVSYQMPLDALLVAVNLTVELLTHQKVS